MLFRAAVLLAAAGVASAGVSPELRVGVAAGDKAGYSGAFEPSIEWTTDGSVLEYDYEGGVNLRADDLSTSDIPFRAWGVLKRAAGDWNVKARAQTNSDDLQHLDIDVSADGGKADTTLTAKGSVDVDAQSGEITEVGLSQSFEAPGGDLTLNPRFNVASGKANITAVYEMGDDTTVTLDADMDNQKVTVAQRLDDDNVIAPSINSDGDVEIKYTRKMGDGTMTAHYRPNEDTKITYEEGPWVATADIPMDGFYKISDGAKLSFKRSVGIEAS